MRERSRGKRLAGAFMLCRCVALVVGAAGLLAACGGGGGGSSPQSPSSPTGHINGISVPPEPDPQANVATVAGVDSNVNGIRDDIERQIASNFGTEPSTFALATRHAQRLQAAIATPSATATSSYLDVIRCMSDSQLLERLSVQTEATLNTPARWREYRGALAGASISSEGC
jgi:hypothetical protein